MADGSHQGACEPARKRQFIVGGRPTQDPVAVRKAPEANDRCLVHAVHSASNCHRQAARSGALQAPDVPDPRCAQMADRRNSRSAGVMARSSPSCNELLGQAARERIRGEGARCSSKHVARKLIHDDDRRKQRARACELSSITPCNALVQFDEVPSYPLIKLKSSCWQTIGMSRSRGTRSQGPVRPTEVRSARLRQGRT